MPQNPNISPSAISQTTYDSTNEAIRANIVAGDITINPGDIEIGAVEIKNATTDDRATVLNATPVTGFGLTVRPTPVSSAFFSRSNTTIGTASVQHLVVNTARRGLIITNVSTGGQRISFNFSTIAAVLDMGITLYPGGTYVMDAFSFSTEEGRAISSAAGGLLSMHEFQ